MGKTTKIKKKLSCTKSRAQWILATIRAEYVDFLLATQELKGYSAHNYNSVHSDFLQCETVAWVGSSIPEGWRH
jgi:hypothetical protein